MTVSSLNYVGKGLDKISGMVMLDIVLSLAVGVIMILNTFYEFNLTMRDEIHPVKMSIVQLIHLANGILWLTGAIGTLIYVLKFKK